MKRITVSFLLVLLTIIIIFFSGCGSSEKKITVYAGKGLKAAVDEIVLSFQQTHGVNVNVIYGGSQTMLTVIENTQRGDIFIPGNLKYIDQAGDLIAHYTIVAKHRPMVIVRVDNSKKINSFYDLAQKGIRLGIGNKEIAAIGSVTDEMFQRMNTPDEYLENITLRGSTANELLDLVIQGEVDAVISHSHLLHLSKYRDLRGVKIPIELMPSFDIPVAVLRFSENRKSAELFSKFVDTEGRRIFQKYGFGE